MFTNTTATSTSATLTLPEGTGNHVRLGIGDSTAQPPREPNDPVCTRCEMPRSRHIPIFTPIGTLSVCRDAPIFRSRGE